MRFTELLREIQATYREQPRKYHVLATRYYIGVDSLEMLKLQGLPRGSRAPYLSKEQIQAIIENR